MAKSPYLRLELYFIAALTSRDVRLGILGSTNVSLTIFTISVSGNKSLSSIVYRIFHSGDHQALGGRLMLPKEMEDLAAFNAREENCSRGKREGYSSAEAK